MIAPARPWLGRTRAHGRALINLRKTTRILFYGAIRPVMLAALAAGFRRIRTRGAHRFPRGGAVLLVANHPAAWADVVVLGALLGRPLHFLAHAYQFRPWPRRIVVGMWGTLPVYGSEAGAGVRDDRNVETLRRSEALLDQGEVVTVFPEGVSRLERGLMPLRFGAARLALAYAAKGRRPLALVPVGIHYSDRTAARCDLTLSVGEPIPVPRIGTVGIVELERSAGRLTERIEEAIGSLLVNARSPRVASILRTLEPVAAGGGEALGLEEGQTLARSLEALATERPGELEELEHHAREWDGVRASLGVSARAFAPRAPARNPWSRAAAATGAVLGVIPALAGAMLHLVPAILSRVLSRRFGSEPHRVAFARMAVGFAWWTSIAAIAWIAGIARGTDGLAWAATLAGGAMLALFAGEYGAWARLRLERLRLVWIRRTRAELWSRARREYADLSDRVRVLLKEHSDGRPRLAAERRR